jgi:hypothetical protein
MVIIKVIRFNKKRRSILSFFSVPKFKKWFIKGVAKKCINITINSLYDINCVSYKQIPCTKYEKKPKNINPTGIIIILFYIFQ